MQTKETITLSGVPETMLQTVYARAKESSGRGAIRDRKAEETIGGLQYDFSLADRDKAMHSGVIARTIVLDRLTGAWLQEHPTEKQPRFDVIEVYGEENASGPPRINHLENAFGG